MKRIIIIPFILISLAISATNYYVKNAGNDNNTGLSDAQAWAHHPWMSTWTGSVTIASGDVVFMKRGDIWSVSSPSTPYMVTNVSGSSGHYITTTAYDTGNKPVIKIATNSTQDVIWIYGDSFLIFDNLDIQHYSNIYSGNVGYKGIFIRKDSDNDIISHDIIITNCEIHNIPYTCISTDENAYNITVGDTTATGTATSTNYSNNIHDFGYSGISLLGVDPIREESHFCVYYNYIHDATRTIVGDLEYGISITANASSTAWPKYALIRYNRVENIKTWSAVSCHGGSYIYFQDNYVKNFGRTGIAASGTSGVGALPATCNHLSIERNTVEQDVEWVTGGEYAFICHIPAVGTPSTNIYITNNNLFYTTRPATGTFPGIYAGNTNGLTISGNYIHNGSIANSFSGIHIFMAYGTFGNKDLVIDGNYISEWGPAIKLVGSSITGAVAIKNNVLVSIPHTLIQSIDDDFSATSALTIYNNTCIQKISGTSYGFDLLGVDAGGSVKIKNNIIGKTDTGRLYYVYVSGAIDGTFECNFNLYWNSSAGSPFYLGGSGTDWTAWTKTLGYDTHGIGPNTNPLFQNYSGSYSQDLDFQLQKSSPAINAGTDVGLTSDYAGNPISGFPDIGAFELSADPSTPAPVLISSSVENAAPSKLQMNYNLSLVNIIPAASAFTVTVNSVTRSVSAIAVSGTTVTLTLSTPAAYGDVVTVAYTKPSANPLQTSAGGQAASFSAQNVTNNVAAPVPVYVNSSVENATPSRLDMNYNLSLANIVSAASAFSVNVNSSTRSVSSVAISGTKVMLTLSSAVAYGDVVTVAYTKPSSNPLQTSAGGQAASFSARNVTNNLAAPAIPAYLSSSIENAAPTKIQLNYNLSLANIIPAASAFTITVNSVTRSVSSVVVSGTIVTLTLSTPVAYGDVVTLAYTKPASNPLQTSAGGQAASFSAQNVTNNIVAPGVPAYLSSSIENGTPSKLQMNYNLTLANIVPAASSFAVIVNSGTRTVSGIAISGTTVTLTLSTPVAYGDVVTVAYTKPVSNPLQTSAGGQAASFSARNVTNNIAAPAVPAYLTSSIENAAPTKLQMNYNLALTNIVPAASSFAVIVNSVTRTVSAVAISGTTVTLTLSTPVAYGDVITVAYTKPASNPLRTTAGGQAVSFTSQTVSNKVLLNNTAPVVMVNYSSSAYSGFVNELNAGGTYDVNNDKLTFSWVIPDNISASSNTGSAIQYLSPIVESTQEVDFVLNVNDGKTTQSKSLPVEILPYEPGLDIAEVTNVEASGFLAPNYPYNIIDGNIGTMWVADGDNQWLLLELKELFNVQHVKLAFQPGQKREAFFDILGSDDKVTWEPILTKSNSCTFSGNLQVFDFPPSKTGKEFKYVKLTGHGNSTDTWNYISEFRIFGYRHKNPIANEILPVIIYPNPAGNFFNIKIEESSVVHDFIKIISLTGSVLFVEKIDPGVREFRVPVKLLKGVYLVQIGSGSMTFFSQKLVIAK